ncbi:MAG: cation:dicarboxylase symporter family transporter [Treponema sp.]|nr:cation:dicarboxylase symporter family transporter [Treponema sp.]
MKIWIKLLIGSVLGVILGFLVPEHQQLVEGLAWLEGLALRIGRYVVIPMIVFSLTIGIYELRQDGQFWPLVLKNGMLIVGVSIFMIFAGVLATLAFPPARIPILTEEQLEIIRLDISGSIYELFPYNMLSVLTGDGVYLFPVCVFAFFFGMGLSYDRSYSKPVIVLVDSLSKVFYHVASFVIEILGFIMIVLSAYWAIRFREVLRADIFLDLILLLGVLGVVLGFGILPSFLYLLRPKANPWRVLYGSLGSAIAAFFSGDINFSLPVLLNQTKENLGVRRRSNVLSLTLFSTFCRAGSAMVATVAFIVIFNSYSSLGISFIEILSISFSALGISFLLARHPGEGAYTALAVLCLSYGKGFEASYLILKPLAFYLIAIGAFLDVMIASFATYATARMSGFISAKE